MCVGLPGSLRQPTDRGKILRPLPGVSSILNLARVLAWVDVSRHCSPQSVPSLLSSVPWMQHSFLAGSGHAPPHVDVTVGLPFVSFPQH